MWFIFRHGETKHNLIHHRIQGRYPSLLTIKGIEQVKSIGYRILDKEKNLDDYKFITSPMTRTQHSIQILQEVLGKLSIEPITEPLIQETDAGNFTNVLCHEVQNEIDKRREQKINDFWNTSYSGGETYNQVYSRMQQFYYKYMNEKNLIISTHGCGVKFLQNILKGNDKFEIENKKINQNYFVCWDGKNIEVI